MYSFLAKLKTDDRAHYPFSSLSDWVLFSVVLALGAAFTFYIHKLGLVLFLVDQFSHASIARQIIDSVTPGMSQVGFWPPLLHILLAPFAAIDALYYSGFAGAVLLVPVLGLSVVFFSRTIYLLTDNRVIGYLIALFLLFNPYVLYFSVTPMMEMLFMGMIFGVVYFFVHWWMYQDLFSLVLLGFFVSLATLARFEGFILLPIVGIALLSKLLMERKRYMYIEAVATIFGLVAATGVVFIVVYGYIFGGDPLSFLTNSWGAYDQQRDFVLPGEGHIWNAVRYMAAAATTMLGESLLILTLVELVLLILLVKSQRWLVFFVLAIFSGPFLFDILAVFQGSAIVYLPSLPPYPDFYFNVRYGLFIIGVVLIIPAIIAGILCPKKLSFDRFISVGFFLTTLIVALLAHSMFIYAKDVVCPTCFEVVRKSNQVSPSDHYEVAEALKKNYEGGFVLMTRALHNEVAVRAGIPLQQYILEANDYFFTQAVEAPWWYARYVVMFNPNKFAHKPWLLEHEAVSKKWAKDGEFHYFYQPVFLNETEGLYVLNMDRLKEHARTHDLDESWIPVLQEGVEPWDVEHAHLRIERAFEEWHAKNS